MTMLSEAIYRLYTILIKFPMVFSTELGPKNLKLVWIHKRLQITKTILIKKNKAGGTKLPNIRLYYSYRNQNSMVLTQRQI